MKDKKQSIFEHIMTYGWVILILVIIGVALYSLDIFKPSSTKSCVGFDRFIYHDHAFSADGKTIQLHIGNLNNNACITSVSITDANGIVHEFDGFNEDAVCERSEGYLITMGSKNITMSSVIGSLGAVGSEYNEFEVSIMYDVIDGIKNQIDNAVCRGTFN
ncbi:MAG: hypothetical protein PHW96_02805 [Candidatus Nanoarchaeia archaeon]|nr:hypothetical protein [Candidatus Nanoarchaeia archaeon]